MPPSKPAGKGRANEESKEEALQAVILADSFESKFAPYSLERPRCLLPLGNTPLIEYTFDFLARAGVQEVYLYAGSHVDHVETYIKASRWKSTTSPFNKVELIRCVATSVGDVMRDLDQKDILSGDFLVVSGDVVSDFPITGALKAHKLRRERDKNAIMTLVLREVQAEYYSESNSTIPTFVIDPAADRCLHYEESSRVGSKSVAIDPEMLKTPELDIRQDLIDCRVDICTPDVLSLWSDNFDNQSPRKDFVFGVLKDFELNGKTIHVHILESHYAARSEDLWSYAKISQDLVAGSIPSFQTGSSLSAAGRKSRIRGERVKISRPVEIDDKTILGADSSVGERSRIERSVVGQRCHIGQAAAISSSYIWDDVTVGDNVKISHAILGEKSIIGDNCIIEPGALVSFGVKIPSGTKILAGAKVSKKVGGEGEGQGTASDQSDFAYDEDDDEADDFSPGLVYQQKEFAESLSTLASDITTPSSPLNGSRRQSFATNLSEEDETTDRFQQDTVAILVQRMQEGKQADDMLSELMGLRFSGGADETEVRRAVAAAVSRRMTNLVEEAIPAADASRRTLQAYHTLIRRDQAEQTTAEQVDFLLDVQKDLSRRHEGAKVLLFMVKDLYDLEVLAEESFLSWWVDGRSTAEEGMREVRKQATQFIEWLQNAESIATALPLFQPEQPAVSPRDAAALPPATTPTPLGKRKAFESAGGEAGSPSAKARRIDGTLLQTPGTPVSEERPSPCGTMDSDEDMMSDLLSGDEVDLDDGTQDSEIGSIEDFDHEADNTFGYDKDYLTNPAKPYEIDFKVLSPTDIESQQEKQFEEVSNILELPVEQAAILLRFMRWNKEKLIESYVDNPTKTLEAAGLGPSFSDAPRTKAVQGFECEICYEDGPGLMTYAMKCNHRYCADCYRQYLTQKVKEEGEAARIECPRDGCSRIVDGKSLRLLVDDEVLRRYNVLLTRTYVDDKDNLKWCPAPECEYAIECAIKKRDLSRVVPTVRCSHEHSFCFGCTLADHQPAPCGLVKKWLKKCEDDSETSNWISANTKECPKCQSTIEKNGGCNHMICRKCKHEFCWMCMGPWSEHGTSWYNCNRYEEQSGAEARDAQAKSRHSLERYLHYYNRYANHEQSAKLDKDLWLKTEKKMTSLQSQSDMSWIEVQFLDTASKALQACRQTLKWTYAFAFYLARNNMTEIFEDNQKDLEMAVENLSAMFEKPVNELAALKVDILDKTSYCNRRREILLSDTAENLKKGKFCYFVSVKVLTRRQINGSLMLKYEDLEPTCFSLFSPVLDEEFSLVLDEEFSLVLDEEFSLVLDEEFSLVLDEEFIAVVVTLSAAAAVTMVTTMVPGDTG
ncbi:hypothetical protein DV735_g3835, partial [Chaetothyriales sp. CBS 134920]